MPAGTELPGHECVLHETGRRQVTDPCACADEEVKAVRVLQSAIQNHPQSYALLHVQCDFLLSKGKTEWALKLAKQAVNCAPSEFVTWAKLTEVNMGLGRYTDALLTLNSCPMFTYAERDLHRMPTPAKSHLPIKDFIAASGILDDENAAHSSDADVALLRLPAPSLRGTFAKAYVLLAKLVSLIGWDELLKCRSQVFVMEEEYRMHRAHDPQPESPLNPNGPAAAGGDDDDVKEGFGPLAIATDDEGSEKAPSIKDGDEGAVPTIAVNGEEAKGEGDGAGGDDGDESPAIPTIKVSTESDGEREREELRRFEESEAGRKARELEKPVMARKSVDEKRDDDAANGVEDTPLQQHEAAAGAGIQNKRLCERWLDNLFMVLYEVGLRLIPLFPLRFL